MHTSAGGVVESPGAEDMTNDLSEVYAFGGTPFNSRTAPLNKWRRWVSWDRFHLVDVFSTIEEELGAIRNRAAVIEMSPLSQHVIAGPDAARLVDRVITRRVDTMANRQVYYSPWCDHDGKMIGDGIVVRLEENRFIMTADPMMTWLAQCSTDLDVEFENTQGANGLLALQGPRSRSVLERLTGRDWSDLKFSRGTEARVAGLDVWVWRQGFTGELGYEFWVPAESAPTLWDAVIEAGEPDGLLPAGHFAEDVARIEAGLLIVGADYLGSGPDRSAHPTAEQEESFVTPYELGLGHFVDFDKPEFMGREALLKARDAPQKRRLAGVVVNWREIVDVYLDIGRPPVVLPRVHRDPQVPIHRGGERVGHATSVTWSPTVEQVIGFAHIHPAAADPGTEVTLGWDVMGEEHAVSGTVVELPFLPMRRAAG